MATLAQNPFQNQDDDKNKDLTNIGMSQGGGAPTAGQMGMAPQQAGSQAQAPARQGSGRFTNIQRFSEAQRGAGERIAGAIGQRVEERLQPLEGQAQTQASQIGQAIDDTRQTVQAAAQSYGNVLSTEEGARNLVTGPQNQGVPVQSEGQAQPAQLEGTPAQADGIPVQGQVDGQQPNFQYDPSFGGFVNFMTGQYVDADGLTRQLSQAQMAQMQAQRESSNLAQALMVEEGGALGGRFGLLRDTFLGQSPSYTTGMQRLDQALLQTQAPQALTGLQQTVATRDQALQNLGQQVGGRFEDFQNLLNFQQQQQQQLQGRSDELFGSAETDVNQQLEATLGDLRQQQAQATNDIAAARAFLTETDLPEGVTREQIERGLQLMGTSDIGELNLSGASFGGMDLSDASFLNMAQLSDQLTSYKTSEQAARLNALEQLRALSLDPTNRFTGNFEGINAFTQRQRDRSIADMAREDLLSRAEGVNVRGQGRQAQRDNRFIRLGNRPDAVETIDKNLKVLLEENPDLNSQIISSDPYGQGFFNPIAIDNRVYNEAKGIARKKALDQFQKNLDSALKNLNVGETAAERFKRLGL